MRQDILAVRVRVERDHYIPPIRISDGDGSGWTTAAPTEEPRPVSRSPRYPS